jgi:hypothetical protein
MKRLIGALLLTLGLVAALPLQTADAAAKGPDCVVVEGATGNYVDLRQYGGQPTLSVDFTLQGKAPACSALAYTVTARTTAGGYLASSSQLEEHAEQGSSSIEYSYTISIAFPGSPPADLCAQLTSAPPRGGYVFDSVPTTRDEICTGGGTYLALLDGTGLQTMR